MSSLIDYQFARCKVMSQAREVWLDGELQDVPPRVFDLLLHLLKHPERVVGRDEIMQDVWLGRTVTDNVVSRAVMIARSVIGDSKSKPVLIKTVQRVGYRFTGQLLEPSRQRVAQIPGAMSGAARERGIRLALLPLLNQTGQDELAWVELGLPALISQTIGTDTGSEVIATSAVLTALDDRPLSLMRADLARHVLQGLGATLLIETSVTRHNRGYSLEYLAHGRHALGFAGVLQGNQLTELAQRLARAIRQHLLGEKDLVAPFQSADPFVSECFARGMQALNQQEFGKAVDLLRVVRQLEPQNTRLELTYLAALGAAGHADTLKLAEQMIERGRETGDRFVENSARKILARALLEDKRDVAAADHVLDRLFAAAPPEPMQGWYIEALMMRSRIRLDQGDRRAAREILARTLALCDDNGNQILRMWVLNNRAALEAKEGNLWLARETFREVHDLLVSMQRPMDCAKAQSNFAITDFHLGLIEEAIREMDGAMQRMQKIAVVPQKIPNAIMAAAMMFAHVHDTEKIKELEHCLLQGTWSESAGSNEFLPYVVGAYCSYCNGDLKGDADMFWLAIESAQTKGQTQQIQSWLPMANMHLTLAERYHEAHRAASLFNQATEKLFPWAPCVMLHASAIEATQSGERWRARQLLLDALQKAQGGLTEAFIRIDLAWMHLCDDEIETAQSLCSTIEPWLSQHPAGLVVQAMFESRAGRVDGALRAIRAHLQIVERQCQSRFAGLVEQIALQQATGGRVDLSRFMQLPTSYLLQKTTAATSAAHDSAVSQAPRHRNEATSN